MKNNDLSLEKFIVFCVDSEDEKDLVESLIEENIDETYE